MNLKILSIRLTLLLVPFIFVSCGTIFNGSKEDISITSHPDDAKIRINGEQYGRGRVQTELKKNNNYTVQVNREGCAQQQATLSPGGGGGYLVLDFLLFFPGLFVDLGTGAHKSFSKSSYHFELDCDN